MMDSSLGQHGIVLNLTFPKIVGSLSLSKLNYTLWQYKCEIEHLKQTHRSTFKKKIKLHFDNEYINISGHIFYL